MNQLFRIALFSLTLLLAGLQVAGQSAEVRVVDGKTGQAVGFAHVCFQPLDGSKQLHAITEENGAAPNLAPSRSVVAISYVGYETLYDTINAGEIVTLSLKPKVQNMSELVVTAQYTPQRADQSIYKVKVINSRQIQERAANTLNDLLNSELNIRIRNTGAFGTSMSLQGLSGEHIKFLVDGVPVIGRMNGEIDISQINLYNVDHIELIEGPMSVVYGSNALAGVINIITKENRNSSLSAYGRGYAESVGMYNFDFGASAKKKDHVFSVSGGRNFFGGYSPDDSLRSVSGEDDRYVYDPKRQYFFDGYYIYSKPRTKFKVSSSWFDEKILNRGDLIGPYYETAFDTYFITGRSTSRVELNQKIRDFRFLNLTGSYAFYARKKQTYYKDLTTLTEVPTTNPEDWDTTRFHNILLRGTLSKSNPASRFNYQLGFDVNSEIGTGKRITDNRQQIGDYALFLSVQYQPWKWFDLQPGIRYIYNTKYAAPLVYSLNLKFGFREHYSIRTSFSRGFRAPSLKELYLYFVDVNHNVQGNPDLQSENSYNVNLSFQYNRETARSFIGSEINFFYNNINNVITLANASGDLYTYINVDKYLTRGFQAVVNYRLYPWWNLKTGAGLTGKYTALEEDDQPDKQYYYSPDAMVSTTYRWLKYDVDFNLIYKFTGKMSQFYILTDGSVIEGYVSAYHNMDFTVQKPFFRNRLTIGAGVKNIFNNTTIPAAAEGGVHSGGTSAMSVGYGRTVFIQASVHLNKY